MEFTVKPLSDVTVSLYLPHEIEGGQITTHAQGDQNTFVADGDVSGKPTLVPAGTLQSYYLLTNVDIWGDRAVGAVVALVRRLPIVATLPSAQISVGPICWPNA